MSNKMTDGEFGTWQCGNPACPNSELKGMEARRRYKPVDPILPVEPTLIRCGLCKTTTAVQQVGR